MLPFSKVAYIVKVLKKGLDSINKEGLLKNKLPKGDLRGVATKVLRVVFPIIGGESILLLLSP